ncbi:MAG: DNA primase, partial [Armatimonadetes bacterium]|nr:DNA primase [Armatimonadota bacterium]
AAQTEHPGKKTKWYFETAKARKISSFIELARPKCEIEVEQLDTHPFLFNVKNGTLDLLTGELLPHNPEHFLTKCLDIEFDPDAECPRWKEFLSSIMGGSENLVSYLQRAVGYSLTGDVREQIMFLLHGNGANGKSTFLDTVADLLGEYAQTAPTEMLMAKRGDKGVPNDIARLRGSRFVTAVETEEGRRLSEVLVKQLTGGDKITARFLNQEFFEFTPSHKIFLATNHLPKVKGTDHAIWRRLPLIPFKQTFWNPDKGEEGPPELRMDKTLPAKLREELPGILTWALTGCLNWKRDGLGWPPEVRAATDAYQSDQDSLASFLDECCTIGDTFVVAMADLYAAYCRWADDAGERASSKKELGKRLEERGFRPDTGSGHKAIRRGIGLLQPVKEPTMEF